MRAHLSADVRQYALITGNYWAFTLTDGALRMLVVLHFHQLGYSPLQIAMLFLFYEVFGVVTNLVGGWLGARIGLNRTMNIGLANGAEGYIPPPEQHALGGYTTWPARTAGLEVQAEPKITAALVSLLEKVSGKPARNPQPPETGYSKAVTALNPVAFFRMEEMEAGAATDSTGKHEAVIEPGVAVFLPGPGP